MRCVSAVLNIVLLLVLLAPHAVVGEAPRVPDEVFVKGYSWGWTGRPGEYRSAAAAESMARLAATGANTVCIAFATEMPTSQTPRFGWSTDNPHMATDADVRRAIDLAEEHGLRVILKPVVNCRDGVWRAWIKFYRDATEPERTAGAAGVLDPWRDVPTRLEGSVVDAERWNEWWDAYAAFILHYAAIAEERNVALFCIGCEMSSTEEHEDRWRALIAKVRQTYRGPIVYNANHDRVDAVPWWDAVDMIGVSAYYPVPPPAGLSDAEAAAKTTALAEITAELRQVRARLAAASEKWDRPILFIETGVCSVRGGARAPWASPGDPRTQPTDHAEQANYYQAMFDVFYDEPWFAGFAWWDWPARLYDAERAERHRGFCAFGKQAERVLRQAYANPRAPAGTP